MIIKYHKVETMARMKQTDFESNIHILKETDCVKDFIRNVVDKSAQEDAFYVCDIRDLIRKHYIWKAALPRVDPYYAVKCNDEKIVLQTLATLGTGFDCASQYEIDSVLSLGVKTKKIIFANTVKPSSHIIHAKKVGVQMMTFDNKAELKKIKKYYPEANLLIRIRCDAKNAQSILGTKFGCDPESEANELLKLARLMELNVIGVCFHVGSNCREFEAYSRAIGAARRIFELAVLEGYNFEMLDIGGGYLGSYNAGFEKVAEIINNALEKNFPDPSIRIIAEPGRYYVHTAYTLACNIHSMKDIEQNGERRRMYYINEGVFSSFSSKYLCDEIYIPQPLQSYSEKNTLPCCIYGQTCDAIDIVVDNFLLPEMKIGDWIIFEEMGAYTTSLFSHFNGYPNATVFYVVDNFTKNILKNMALLNTKASKTGLRMKKHLQYETWFKEIIHRLIFSLVTTSILQCIDIFS